VSSTCRRAASWPTSNATWSCAMVWPWGCAGCLPALTLRATLPLRFARRAVGGMTTGDFRPRAIFAAFLSRRLTDAKTSLPLPWQAPCPGVRLRGCPVVYEAAPSLGCWRTVLGWGWHWATMLAAVGAVRPFSACGSKSKALRAVHGRHLFGTALPFSARPVCCRFSSVAIARQTPQGYQDENAAHKTMQRAPCAFSSLCLCLLSCSFCHKQGLIMQFRRSYWCCARRGQATAPR
jgi:hypothetical protein